MAGFDGPPKKQGKNKPARNDKGQLLPGHTANPNGRPKGSISPKTYFRRAWEERFTEEERLDWAEGIIRASSERAFCLTEFVNRMDGKVPDKVLTGELVTIELDWGDANGSTEDAGSDAEATSESGSNRLRS